MMWLFILMGGLTAMGVGYFALKTVGAERWFEKMIATQRAMKDELEHDEIDETFADQVVPDKGAE